MESASVPRTLPSEDPTGAAPSNAVTKIVDRIPRPGEAAELEGAIKALIAAALRFPGHLGVTVTRPALPVQPGFRIVYRFDTCEHLRDWEESEEAARLTGEADRYTQGQPQRSELSGLEAWFTLPGQATAMQPRKGRMTILTWIGIFPLVYVFQTLAAIVLPANVPVLARVGIVTLLVVVTMSYAVGPLMTKLLRSWLQGARPPQKD